MTTKKETIERYVFDTETEAKLAELGFVQTSNAGQYENDNGIYVYADDNDNFTIALSEYFYSKLGDTFKKAADIITSATETIKKIYEILTGENENGNGKDISPYRPGAEEVPLADSGRGGDQKVDTGRDSAACQRNG